MKGIYLSEEGKKAIEAKIDELETVMESNREISSIFYSLSGKNLMLKEILSSATIFPVEESFWEDIERSIFKKL